MAQEDLFYLQCIKLSKGDLFSSLDRLPSDKCDFIEADRRNLRELAEMYKQMPAVGNRPCVQYISGEERRIRRNKIAGSTPRLGVLVESDYFSKGEALCTPISCSLNLI